MWYPITWIYIWQTKVRPIPQPVTTAGIYYNSTDWIISLSSDWTNWTTIADKNVWASVVYHDWDTLSESNCGGYFQRWNIYMFPFTWPTTTSSTKKNPLWYWPWTTPWYWNYSTFVTWSDWWMSYAVPNLWGEVDNTDEARKWPCDTWFHIPSLTERTELKSLWETLSIWGSSSWTNLKNYLFMPYSDKIRYDGNIYSQGNNGYYWTTKSNNDTKLANCIYFNDSNFGYSLDANSQWANIRPFKNEPVQPDSSWTVLYQ